MKEHNPVIKGNPLTAIEEEIIEQVEQGHVYREIAQNLDVSVSNVEKHIANIRRSLHAKNLAEVIMKHRQIVNNKEPKMLTEQAEITQLSKNPQWKEIFRKVKVEQEK